MAFHPADLIAALGSDAAVAPQHYLQGVAQPDLPGEVTDPGSGHVPACLGDAHLCMLGGQPYVAVLGQHPATGHRKAVDGGYHGLPYLKVVQQRQLGRAQTLGVALCLVDEVEAGTEGAVAGSRKN